MIKRPKFGTKIVIASSTLLGWIGVGTILFHRLESWTYIQSFYFSVVTVTTVGYGDLSPSSDISRLFTAIYILIGVSIGIVTLGVIGSEILQYREIRYYRRNATSNENEERGHE
ncbi:MAG: potassium channel family protein [Bacteroidota bacterium]